MARQQATEGQFMAVLELSDRIKRGFSSEPAMRAALEGMRIPVPGGALTSRDTLAHLMATQAMQSATSRATLDNLLTVAASERAATVAAGAEPRRTGTPGFGNTSNRAGVRQAHTDPDGSNSVVLEAMGAHLQQSLASTTGDVAAAVSAVGALTQPETIASSLQAAGWLFNIQRDATMLSSIPVPQDVSAALALHNRQGFDNNAMRAAITSLPRLTDTTLDRLTALQPLHTAQRTLDWQREGGIPRELLQRVEELTELIGTAFRAQIMERSLRDVSENMEIASEEQARAFHGLEAAADRAGVGLTHLLFEASRRVQAIRRWQLAVLEGAEPREAANGELTAQSGVGGPFVTLSLTASRARRTATLEAERRQREIMSSLESMAARSQQGGSSGGSNRTNRRAQGRRGGGGGGQSQSRRGGYGGRRGGGDAGAGGRPPAPST